MKAAVLSAVGGPIIIEDIPTPVPKAGEVLVRVVACGVCHTDLHVVKGEVQFPLPCVLGHEISGVVEEVAPDVLALAARGQVSASQPITRRYPLDQVDAAYSALNRGDIVGRAIVTMA